MKKKSALVMMLILLVSFSSCRNQLKKEEQATLNPFMGMQPTETPILLSPQLIASSFDEFNGTFSPDGKEFYFTTNTPTRGIICHTKMDNDGKWTKPTVAFFSGKYSEFDPMFSPDGKRLHFSSKRAINQNDTSGLYNIWYIDKLESDWSEPKPLELDKEGTFYSSMTNQGDVYFNIWTTGNMYKASATSEGYKTEMLPDILNGKRRKEDPFISPDEDYIIFRDNHNGLGKGDLYISFKIEGNWTTPENLGRPINSEYHEMCPYVTSDGKFFIFSSNRINSRYPSYANGNLEEVRAKHHTTDNGELNIYYISADFIKERRKKYK